MPLDFDRWHIHATRSNEQAVTHWYKTMDAYHAKDASQQIKSWMKWLFWLAGNEGGEECHGIRGPCALSLSNDLCRQHPEANFALRATEHFANYLADLYDKMKVNQQKLIGDVGQMYKWFYTPKEPPTKLIGKLGIASGVSLFGSSNCFCRGFHMVFPADLKDIAIVRGLSSKQC